LRKLDGTGKWMELETCYLEEFKEIGITEPSKEHHEEQAIPPPWKRIWVSKKGGKLLL
jgi:hypothetical protein